MTSCGDVHRIPITRQQLMSWTATQLHLTAHA
jgi:hypothetical protein